jgi:hypothetical protein
MEVWLVTMTVLFILYLTLLVLGEDYLSGVDSGCPIMTQIYSHTIPAKVEP